MFFLEMLSHLRVCSFIVAFTIVASMHSTGASSGMQKFSVVSYYKFAAFVPARVRKDVEEVPHVESVLRLVLLLA